MEQVSALRTGRSNSEDLRAFAEREASALFTTELARRQDAWRGALQSVKHTLADLEARCDTALGAAPGAPTEAVSELIEKIVAAAAADADALVQQVEARAKAEAAAAQALVRRLQDEVGSGQDQLRMAREQLDAEQAARAGAEAAAKDAQDALERARSALEAQVRSQEADLQSNRETIAALEQRLAAAQSEGANLSATLADLQRVVQGAVSTLTLVQPAHSPGPATPPADGPKRPTTRGAGSDAPPVELRSSISGYASALLQSVETMYAEDVRSALSPADVVKRLTANIRYAFQLFAERLGSNPAGGESALRNQIAELLRARSATPFGRDLAIAAGEAERHERRPRGASPQPADAARAG